MQDLRLQDNIGFHRACAASRGHVVPIVCLEKEFFETRCSPRRARFILESILDLRRQLRDKGSGLLVAKGDMNNVMTSVLRSIDSSEDKRFAPIVYCQTDLAETNQSLEKLLKKYDKNSELRQVWGATLYSEEVLKSADMSDYAAFCGSLADATVDLPRSDDTSNILRLPKELSDVFDGGAVPLCSMAYLPGLRDLGFTEDEVDVSKVPLPIDNLYVRGGEAEGKERLHDLESRGLFPALQKTRNAMMGKDSSSKLSPWIAHGCISPRQVAFASRDSSLVNDLKRRDYFMMRERHFDTEETIPRVPRHLFSAFKKGRTGFPIIDACMRELVATGVLPARGRKLVASFWIHQLQLDWRVGAVYLESALMDCNPSSNWGNWRDLAEAPMKWNILEESQKWDPKGEYIKRWVPELRELDEEMIHQPWKLPDSHKVRYATVLGYPQPMVEPRVEKLHTLQ